MSHQRVTTITANHNYGNWLMEAVASVANDPYPDKKICVVDDGSTDGSLALAVSFADRIHFSDDAHLRGFLKNTDIPFIVAHHDRPLGPSAARNLGIQLAWNDSDCFAMLDADDAFYPGKLAATVRYIEEAPDEVGAVYADYDTISVDTGLVRREYKEPYSYDRLRQHCLVHSACVVSKKALEKVGLYDVEMRTAEDWDLWLRLGKFFMLVHVPECLMRVRVGSHNSTATVPKEVWQQNWGRIAARVQA